MSYIETRSYQLDDVWQEIGHDRVEKYEKEKHSSLLFCLLFASWLMVYEPWHLTRLVLLLFYVLMRKYSCDVVF